MLDFRTGAITSAALWLTRAPMWLVSYVLVRRQGKRGREGYREEKKLGVHAAAFQADQGDQAQGLIQSVIERFGRLDILVNNASGRLARKDDRQSRIDNAAKRRRGGFAFIEGQSRTIIRD